MDYSNPILIALNFFLFVFFYTAMDRILTRKGSLWALIGTIAVVLPVYCAVSVCLRFMSIARLAFGLCFIFIPIALFYSDPLLKRVALYAGGWIMLIITEAIVGLMFGSEIMGEYALVNCGCYLVIMAMLLAVYVLAVNSFRLKYRNLLRPSDYLTMAVFLLSQFLMFCGLLRLIRADLFFEEGVSPPFQLIVISLVLCVLSDIRLIWMLIRSAKATRTETKNALLTQQIEAQKMYYASLNTQYETIRRMRHDIANHIYTVEALLSDRKIEEAEKYAARISEENEKLTLSRYCAHPVVDAFLTSRAAQLAEKGIEFCVNAVVPRMISIDGTELITALGNLLDNAEEACRSQEKPRIELTVGLSENVLIFRVRNPAPVQEEHTERVPGLDRGIGTLILKELAEKYEGQYTLESDTGQCTASLYLQLAQKN